MAVSRKTQKDVGKYQAKLVGPLTLRQTIFVGIACIVAIILWNIADVFQMNSTDKTGMVIIVAAPIALLGMLNPYGMTCLEFIRQYYEYHILSSKKREYKTVTDDELIKLPSEKQEMDGNKKKQNKKDAPSTHKKLKEFPEYY